MSQVSISIHQQAWQTLNPLHQSLHQTLLYPQDPNIIRYEYMDAPTLLHHIGETSEALVNAVQYFGECLQNNVSVQDIQRAAKRIVEQGEVLLSLQQHIPDLVEAHDSKLAFGALLRRIYQQMFQFLDTYQDIIHQPQAYQNQHVELNLQLDATDEVQLIQQLCHLKPSPNKKSHDWLTIGAALGLGLWMGGCDDE